MRRLYYQKGVLKTAQRFLFNVSVFLNELLPSEL